MNGAQLLLLIGCNFLAVVRIYFHTFAIGSGPDILFVIKRNAEYGLCINVLAIYIRWTAYAGKHVLAVHNHVYTSTVHACPDIAKAVFEKASYRITIQIVAIFSFGDVAYRW